MSCLPVLCCWYVMQLIFQNRPSSCDLAECTLGSREVLADLCKPLLLLLLLSLQSCPTLCDPTDGSPPGSAVPGILQARTLEWVAISFSDAGK